MSLAAVEVDHLKYGPAVEGVLPVFHRRWSARSFADRDVSPSTLAKVFEAARWAASSSNEQPWSFLLGVRNSETHKKIASTLAGFNQEWAPAAPVLILGVTNTRFAKNGNPNYYALYDLGAAAVCLALEAAALGLAAHQMGGFDKEAARQALNIPADYAFGSVIALGYQGEPSALGNEQLIAREIVPRERKPLSAFVFSAWGQAADLA